MDIHQKLLLGLTLAASSMAFAGEDRDEDDEEGFLEIIVMGGIATVDAHDTSIYVSEMETDELIHHDSNDWDSWTVQAGVGYVYPLDVDLESGELQWLPSVTPQINVYYLDGESLSGDVYRFENPAYDQSGYDLEFHSTRLMFDLSLSIAQIEEFSLYALAGAGIAWNHTDLDTYAKPGFEDNTQLHLNSKSSTSFAYEFGAGVTYAAMDELAISLQYLFTGINDVGLGSDPEVFDAQGSDFDVNSQAIMLGLRFAL